MPSMASCLQIIVATVASSSKTKANGRREPLFSEPSMRQFLGAKDLADLH
jgi:hypothetical protein